MKIIIQNITALIITPGKSSIRSTFIFSMDEGRKNFSKIRIARYSTDAIEAVKMGLFSNIFRQQAYSFFIRNIFPCEYEQVLSKNIYVANPIRND